MGREIRKNKKSEYITATLPLEVGQMLLVDCGIQIRRELLFIARAWRTIHIEILLAVDWQSGDEEYVAA